MNKFAKYGSIGFGGIFIACFSFYLINTIINESRRKTELAEIKARNERIHASQLQLAEAFATCAASSLKPQYLQEFIVYELMPLGIAWQLATQLATKSPLDQPIQNYNPAQLLNKHFRQNLSYPMWTEYEKHLGLELKHYRNLSDGIESKFDPSAYVQYPTKFVYESTKAGSLKNAKPSEIEIGSKDLLWPKFNALAVRCKATPYDLDQLTRNQNLPSEHINEDGIEAARISSMENGFNSTLYKQQKLMYWESLTQTPEYKIAYAKIKENNLTIMNAIVAEHELRYLEEKNIQKQANDVIFKTL